MSGLPHATLTLQPPAPRVPHARHSLQTSVTGSSQPPWADSGVSSRG